MSRRERGLELRWPGKYGPDGQRAPIPRLHPPLDLRERIPARGEAGEAGAAGGGRIVHGDNLLALDALADELEGQVDLVYIDPPFATGGEFSVARKVGEGDGELRLPAYDDSFPGGAAGLLEMLDPRVRLIHGMLSATGSLYVHVDPTVGHAVKLLLDDVFGERCFQREIVWRIGWLSGFKTRAKNWIRNHDLIFFYVKDPERFTFNKTYVPHPEGYRRRDGKPPKAPGVPLEDVWNANESEFGLEGRASLDSIQIKSFSREKTGWATQKNESILERIIEASSNPGELVMDVFGGSGTTAAVASRMGRRFVVCDSSAVAVSITRCRLLDDASHGEIERSRVGEHDPVRGRVQVQVEADPDGPRVRLTDFEPDPEGLPPELEEAAWHEQIDAWALDTSGASPFVTAFEAHRSHHRRALVLTSDPLETDADELVLTVRVFDVLGREYETCVSARRTKAGWKMAPG